MPALPEILLLRHGETEWNREGRFQGTMDSALTDRGRDQAAALGEALAALGVAPDTHAAVVSPQGRARETARIALGPLGLDVREDRRLVEIAMGAWTGLRRAEIALRWPGPSEESILDFYARCPDGESLASVATRAGAVLEALDRPTVIVTHGITLRVLCALALGADLSEADRIAVPQGSVARVAGRCLQVVSPQGSNLRAGGRSR